MAAPAKLFSGPPSQLFSMLRQLEREILIIKTAASNTKRRQGRLKLVSSNVGRATRVFFMRN
jgi:hypothetical protein